MLNSIHEGRESVDFCYNSFTMRVIKNLIMAVSIFSSVLYWCGGCSRKPIDQSEQEIEVVSSGPKYEVSEAMAKGAESRMGCKAPNFNVTLSNGQQASLRKIARRRPVVMIALMDGCPCNLKAQALFNQLADQHKDTATFIGVINADQQAADQYTKDTTMNFPIVPDPQLHILDAYKIKRAAYVTLINKNLCIEKVWPGYSADMLREINSMLYRKAKIPEKSFDVKYAPLKMTSGCSFR